MLILPWNRVGFAVAGGMTMGEEHKKNARPSSRGKHEKGQGRKQRDAGGEKGDKRRKKQHRKRKRSQQD